MLVLDLDGTTLLRSGGIAAEDRRAVTALQDAGVHVTIATGRLFSGSRTHARRLGLQGDIACMNGSEVVDIKTGERRVSRYLDEGTLWHSRRAFLVGGLTPYLFAHDNIVYDASGAPYLPLVRVWSNEVVYVEDVYDAHAWRTGLRVSGLGAIGDAGIIARTAKVLRRLVGEHVEVITFPFVSAARHFILVRDRKEDKGTALVRMAESLGIDPARTVAIGDWTNDVPMLIAAGQSFLMGRAPESKWQAPDEVVNSVNHVLDAVAGLGGGVAEVARRVWGIEV